MRIPWLLNPAVWFVFDQLRILLGTLFLLECDQIKEDRIYLFVMLSVLFFFMIGSLVTKSMSSCFTQKMQQWHYSPVQIESGLMFNGLLGTIIIASVIVSLIYYKSVGFNLFLSGLVPVLTGKGGLEDPETMRLYAYASDVYFGPGYVNQFKNTLLPLIVSFVAIRFVLLRRRHDLIVAAILTPVVIILLLGTGQRGPFLLAAFCFIIFLLSVIHRLKKRYVLVLLMTVISLFMVSSLILGRRAKEINNVGDILVLGMELPNRLFKANQLSGVVGFSYIYNQPTSWGTEWLSEIRQKMPYIKDPNYISMGALIHQYLYGTARGTAPISIPGSLWHNLHILGVTLFPFMLGALYQNVYHRLVMGSRTLFRLIIYATLTGVLGLWGAGGIGTLLELGLPSVLLLYILGKWALWTDGWIGKTKQVYRFNNK